jgi:uncharacterized protein (TIGR03067 family)
MKILLRFGVVLLGAIVLPLGATGCSTNGNTKEKSDHDLILLQGKWAEVSVETPDGQSPMPDKGKPKLLHLIIQGESLKLIAGEGDAAITISGKVVLNASKSPKQFDSDWYGKELTDDFSKIGIYKLEGGSLTVCYNNDEKERYVRPTEFKPTRKPWCVLSVWTRAE